MSSGVAVTFEVTSGPMCEGITPQVDWARARAASASMHRDM
jgi:hypothetical protein